MLDAYCNTLSDVAQLKIALQLSKKALPIWTQYFTNNPVGLEVLDGIMKDAKPVKRAAKNIDIEFPKRAIEKIERSLAAATEKNASSPLPIMKSDATLSPMLATCMQPLTNPKWDGALTHSVKLVFTAVFNTLTWILYRRRTDQHETHIYVAINQAADALMRESILTVEEINTILYTYKQELRSANEDSDWENALPAGESEPYDEEDIYRKIIGEKVVKDSVNSTLAKEVLRQMREEGKSYWNELDEYNTGTSRTYSYNAEEKSFWLSEIDVIVGSFHNKIPMTEAEMLQFISQQSVSDLRDSGFEV